MSEQLKKYIDNIQTIEIMKSFIAALHTTYMAGKEAQEIDSYATDKLNHLLVK